MAVFVVFAGLINGLRSSPAARFISVVFVLIAVLVLKRIGLVALIALFFVEVTLLENGVPIAYEPSVWYSGTGYGAVAIIAALALYCFRTVAVAYSSLTSAVKNVRLKPDYRREAAARSRYHSTRVPAALSDCAGWVFTFSGSSSAECAAFALRAPATSTTM